MAQYTCNLCAGVFDEAWSDEEAVDELKATFPGFAVEQCSVVCDDCYQKIIKEPVSG